MENTNKKRVELIYCCGEIREVCDRFLLSESQIRLLRELEHRGYFSYIEIVVLEDNEKYEEI